MMFFVKLFLSTIGVYWLVSGIYAALFFPDDPDGDMKANVWLGIVCTVIIAFLWFGLGIQHHAAWPHPFWIFCIAVWTFIGLYVSTENRKYGLNGCPVLIPVYPIVNWLTGTKKLDGYAHFWKPKEKRNKNWHKEWTT